MSASRYKTIRLQPTKHICHSHREFRHHHAKIDGVADTEQLAIITHKDFHLLLAWIDEQHSARSMIEIEHAAPDHLAPAIIRRLNFDDHVGHVVCRALTLDWFFAKN